MANSINTNQGAFVALHNLNSVNRQGQTIANQQSTGKRVNSAVDNASAWGFYASSSNNNPDTFLYLRNVSASNNGIGVYSSGSRAALLLSHSIITSSGLGVGWKGDNGAIIYSAGDNEITGGGNINFINAPLQ